MEETIQYLQIITNVIIILLFIGLVVLVFGLIKTMKSVSARVGSLSGEITDIKSRLEPAIDNFSDLTKNVNGVFVKVRENVDILGTVVEKVKDTTDNIIEFEKKIQSQIEPPVFETLNTISAVSLGIKTFFDAFKSKNNTGSNEVYIHDKIEEIEDSISDVNNELDKVNMKLNNS
ncbi:MAG TPA: DUF948 domain-containing protein [Ignavibacteria bacterium]|nr:DUF948 domain-containing protein [Ignavibacteria bacterium]